MADNMKFIDMNYIRGYVTVLFTGNYPERFLNLCKHHRIQIWDLRYREDSYSFNISIEDFKKLRPLVYKSKSRLIIIDKKGVPFLLHRYRKRKMTAVGLLMFFVILYMLSFFLWDIQFEGNSKYTDDTLMKFVESNGYTHGMKIKDISCDTLEKLIRSQYNDITWVSAMIDGTRLVVKIKENPILLQMKDNTENDGGKPCDLVANKSGIVDSIITRDGVPLVCVGTQVNVGDILISGVLEMKDDSSQTVGYHYVQADGDVYLKTIYPYRDEESLIYLQREYTNVSNHYYIKVLENKLDIFPKRKLREQEDIITKETQLKIFSNFYLPFYLGKVSTKSYREREERRTDEDAIALNNQRLENYIQILEDADIKVLENKVATYINGDECISVGELEVVEKVGELKDIHIEE